MPGEERRHEAALRSQEILARSSCETQLNPLDR
jgi:hypothetical protein